MVEQVKILEKYGPLRSGCIYNLHKEGYDYYTLRYHGANICVPKNLVTFDITDYSKENKDPEYGYIFDEDIANYLDEYITNGVL